MKNTILIILLLIISQLQAKEFFISTLGNDTYVGTKAKPFKTIAKALSEVKKLAGKENVTVWFNDGNYYLSKTITLGSEYSGTAQYPVVFSALPGANVVIKGSKNLENLKWFVNKEGVYHTQVPAGTVFDQLFINGERQIRARFPNYDYENPLRSGKGYEMVTDGTDNRYDTWFSYNAKTFTNKKWKNPETGIIHAFQSHNWGNMQYHLKDVNREEQKVNLNEGGWQLQRKYGIGGSDDNATYYFIENIFEELDVPQEWFLDTVSNTLYYYPKKGVNMAEVKVEVPVISELIQLKGTSESPVKNIHFKGFKFTQTNYTFFDAYEPLARGDWAIHRGGALFMEGAENCSVEDCNFEYLGGNGVFMNGYNRGNSVRNCQFVHTGESAVCFVGLPSAVRFYQTWDDKEILGKNWEEMRKNMDLKPGPKTDDYPKDCVVENSIMHDFGDVGKQVAGIFISMSHKIRASHNTIYNCPRAGICINDGTWGGHIIEFNDIWETVRETGEHGPFNAWGRERQWKGSRGSDQDFIKELTKLDAIDNVIVRNNRIANYRKSISAGNWTIDLDDGSSYYEIYNNLSLGSTIKLRDGMSRKVFNNITVSAVPLGWHVWPKESQDEIYNNIFVISGAIPGKEGSTKNFIRPVGLPTDTKWSTNYNHNLYWNVNYPTDFLITENLNFQEWKQQGYDTNSEIGSPNFENPLNGNYQVKGDSPALKLGFKNFPMDQFGHQMTQIVPFGGEFAKEKQVVLNADIRAGQGAKIYYTKDGSEPNPTSLQYIKPIKVQKTTTIKAQTFDANGAKVGFETEANFEKVNTVSYPNWLATLLAGKYEGDTKKVSAKALKKEVMGALLLNIADDPDLIDATGGYNFGCYIESINAAKGQFWLDSTLDRDWVIQQFNNHKILNISDLEKYLQKYKGKTVRITAYRDYNSKIFEVQIP